MNGEVVVLVLIVTIAVFWSLGIYWVGFSHGQKDVSEHFFSSVGNHLSAKRSK